MAEPHEHIEEKIVPYLEGVLSLKERRELDEAIGSDGELARDVAQLRQVILNLRHGFAEGAKPHQEELSVEEVLELSSGSGGTESVVGSSEQKAKLFCSDRALEEFSLLRALQDEMSRTTLDTENVPPLPAALRQEFAALPTQNIKKPTRAAPVVSLSWWRKASAALDRVDPRPYMATAAALLLLTFGIHHYTRSPAPLARETDALDGALSPGSSELAASDLERAEARAASRAPSGIAVFVSDDRGLLKAQAEKLLARKVRFVLSEDRLLVAEQDLESARAILWGGDEKLLAAHSKAQGEERDLEQAEESFVAQEPLAEEDPDQEREVTFYDSSSSRSAAVSNDDLTAAAAEPSSPEYESERPPGRSVSKGESTNDNVGPPRPQMIDLSGGAVGSSVTRPSAYSDRPVRAIPVQSSDAEAPAPQPVRVGAPAASKIESDEARRQRLKDLAAGNVAAPAPPTRTARSAGTAVSVPAVRAEARPPSSSDSSQGEGPIISIEGSSSVSAGQTPIQPPPSATLPTAAAPPASEQAAEAEAQHIASVESKRAGVARQFSVDISLQSEMGRVTAFVRPKGNLNEAQRDELRRSVRAALGLKETDSIVLR